MQPLLPLLLCRLHELEVGFSIATADETIRVLFEPGAPPVSERIRALDLLHAAGIKTFARRKSDEQVAVDHDAVLGDRDRRLPVAFGRAW